MYYPSLEDVTKLAEQGNLIPVYREVSADLETPVSAYLKIAQAPYAFLLESVEGGERLARYSFIGTEPFDVIRTGLDQPQGEGDPLLLIEDKLAKYTPVSVEGLPRFVGGAVGFLSYDTVRYFENIPSPVEDTLGTPEALFLLVDTMLVFDHARHKIKVVSHVHISGEDIEGAYGQAIERIERLVAKLDQPLNMELYRRNNDNACKRSQEISFNISKNEYHSIVDRIKDYIYAGDVIQTVLSQRLSVKTDAAPFDIYRSLRTVNPSPYMYFLEFEDFCIAGTSPELLVQVEEGVVSNHPIAGTRPRGSNEDEDSALEVELRENEKERAEHIMLVDLARNDIGRVSVPGTVEVTQLMDVERYSHVMHLVSHVQGILRPELTVYDTLRASFPAGTVSGAPKIRAMQIISELEPDRRGPYAGAVGYFGFSGNMDTAITIRTIVIKNGIAYIQAGGGIVADSTSEGEYQETLHKAQALLRALAEA